MRRVIRNRACADSNVIEEKHLEVQDCRGSNIYAYSVTSASVKSGQRIRILTLIDSYYYWHQLHAYGQMSPKGGHRTIKEAIQWIFDQVSHNAVLDVVELQDACELKTWAESVVSS